MDGKRGMKIPFATSPVDEWLDEKKKVDGADGLWRIHDKLYDFTIWSRIHPGGKFWLDISRVPNYTQEKGLEEAQLKFTNCGTTLKCPTSIKLSIRLPDDWPDITRGKSPATELLENDVLVKGTDITEAFESHHFSGKAEEILQNYYIREAATPRNAFCTFDDDGFYKVFKRKVCQKHSAIGTKVSFAHLLINDSLAFAVFLTGLLGAKHGITWTLLSGVLLGILSVSCHSFLHKKNNWRVNYFHLLLMSSREWKIRHLFGHHQYRNTILDLEIPVWQPLSKNLNNNAMLFLDFLLFPIAAHVQFLQRCFDVFLSRKLRFEQEELVSFILPLFLLVTSKLQPWEIFVTWNIIILTGSFVFCLLSFPKRQTQMNLTENAKRNNQDFGILQLSLIGSNPKESKYIFSFLNSFRGNVLHYLCPVLNCGSLHKLIPIFEETISEFGIQNGENSGGFLEGLQNGMPQGHVFFS